MKILEHKFFVRTFLCIAFITFLIYLVFNNTSQTIYAEKILHSNTFSKGSKLNIQYKEKTIKIKLENGYEIEIAKSRLHNIISEIHHERRNILNKFYDENRKQIERIISQAKPGIISELTNWNYDINRLNTHIFYNATAFITNKSLEERILHQYEHILSKHLSLPLSQIDYHFSQRKIKINQDLIENIHKIIQKYVITGDIHIFDGQTIHLTIEKTGKNKEIAKHLFQSISSSIDSNLSLSKNMIGEAGLMTFIMSSVTYRGKITSLASKIPIKNLNAFVKTHFVKLFTLLNIIILIITLIRMPKSISGISIGILIGFILAILLNMIGIFVQDKTSRKQFEEDIANILDNSQNKILTEFNNELDLYYSELEDNIIKNFDTIK